MTPAEDWIVDRDRELLRHFLATIAYRTQKALRDAPPEYPAFSAGNQTRTPVEILRHMASLMGYVRTLFVGGSYPVKPERLATFKDEIARFHDLLEGVGSLLASGAPLQITTEQLLQGPLSDTMTHVGQLALLRRLAGAPVAPENFVHADIRATVLFKHGDPQHLEWRDRAKSGELLSPRIFTTGPLIAGREIHWPHVVVESDAEASAVVREHVSAGYDFIKVYDFLERGAYEGLERTARELGVPFVGHVPEAVGLPAAVDAGQHCIDHADQLIYTVFGRQESMTLPLEETTSIANQMAGRDACFTSTLFGMKTMMKRGSAWFDSLYTRGEMSQVDPGIREWWASFRGSQPSADALARRNHFYEFQRALTKTLHDAGVRVVVGTDAPNLLLIPGFSVHDELQLLVEEVGLSPFEALRAATRDAAAVLDASRKFGTITADGSADLVLLDTNPLNSLAILRKPAGVMVRGRWLDRRALDEMLKAIAN